MIKNRMASSVAVGVAVLGAAVGLAGPASADPTDGPYTATMIDGGGVKRNGDTVVWALSSCGPDCLRIGTSGPGVVMQRQGDVWVQNAADGCTKTLDNASLMLTYQCPDQPNIVIGLVKNG